MPEAQPEPGSVLARLERWGASRAWIGPDPYEGLNSPLGRLAPTRRTRQAVTQAYKRLPFAPPWPLRAAPRDTSSRDLALAARPFLLSLWRESAVHGPFFGYVPGNAPLVHNANLLVCGALARLHALEPDETSREPVEAAVGTTLSLTRPDGLWSYGELPNYGWVDSFHTAYTLEGLCQVNSAYGIGGDALGRGVSAWRAEFIEPDGWARYYPERRLPLETHCCASAIDLLCALDAGEDTPELVEVADAVANTAIRELWIDGEDR